ncbi:hypothetical protein G9F72_019595 [Clostridium estertheticum]|uniref:hypothetical protein n=1 Tax=Clostridium estertheticum TaxID=238834 RepID=UPI0013E97A22|nr:hypothetical protein [Clostridium estertheticum]MBZ9688536.1 hypothetical protein [Clostridium estertheticum]
MNYINNEISNLQQICLDCKDYETPQCIKAKCNVGFALSVVNSMQKNGMTIVKDGLQLIPKEDMKHYDNIMVARCIASICKMCKQCMIGHNENCSVSLARRSIESIVLKEIIDYPGNVLSYIIKVAEQNQNFANLIKNEIQLLD